MNRNEVDEWVGESEITDLFIRELVEFNFLGEQFNHFNYFKDGWENFSYIKSKQPGNGQKRVRTRSVTYATTHTLPTGYQTRNCTLTEDHPQSPQMFCEFLYDTTSPVIREQLNINSDVPDYSLYFDEFKKAFRGSFDTIYVDTDTNSKMKSRSGIDASNCEKFVVEKKYELLNIPLFHFDGTPISKEENEKLFTYAPGYLEWQIEKYDAYAGQNNIFELAA